MSDSLKKKRSLSVYQRLLTLGGAALVGFGAMIAVGWYQNERLAEALVHQQQVNDQVAAVNELRIANLDMVLAAMDTIVVKDEGVVVPARAELMKNSVAVLRDKAPTIEQLAGTTGHKDLFATYAADLAEVETAMLTDLPALVAKKASVEEFAKIDDTIDGAGERIAKLFSVLSSEGTKIADLSVHEAQDMSTMSPIGPV